MDRLSFEMATGLVVIAIFSSGYLLLKAFPGVAVSEKDTRLQFLKDRLRIEIIPENRIAFPLLRKDGASNYRLAHVIFEGGDSIWMTVLPHWDSLCYQDRKMIIETTVSSKRHLQGTIQHIFTYNREGKAAVA